MNYFKGYVLYDNGRHKTPFGVVSENHECQAIAEYLPATLKKYLVAIEDKRFFSHGPFDARGIVRALMHNIRAGAIVEGGSSITQQLARNLLRDNRRSIWRKIKEGAKAIDLELNYTKSEILDLYFNNVFFGKNLWGIRSASLHYFLKEVENLSIKELLYLVTLLRAPNFYSADNDMALKRFHFLNRDLLQKKLISQNRFSRNHRQPLTLKNHPLQTVRSAAIPFISNLVVKKSKTIYTTIDREIHGELINLTQQSRSAISIIATRNGKIVGFASSFGTEYPFTFKTNVGSTLKPFLYCYLTSNGIDPNKKFKSLYNDLHISVREVDYSREEMTLNDALRYSNNNTFINACHEYGLNDCLAFVAKLFQKPTSTFFPSSILGATQSGISLAELALAYDKFFTLEALDASKLECASILNQVLVERYGINIKNAFLKTGTTNFNKEKFAIIKNPDLTFAVLKNDFDPQASKDAGFRSIIKALAKKFMRKKTAYKWS